jgi:hypothetical protein
MFVIYFLLVLIGLLMLIRPGVVWSITESWKSDDAVEPSKVYVWTIRFGGVLCTAAGIGGIFALML